MRQTNSSFGHKLSHRTVCSQCLFVNTQKKSRVPPISTIRRSTTRQVCDIPSPCQLRGNFFRCVNSSHLHNGISRLLHSFCNDGGCLCLSLSPRHICYPLLLSPLHHILLPLCLLRGHLLRLDGLHKFTAERQVGDGDIIQRQMEMRPALNQFGLDPVRNLSTLTQKLLRIVLRHNRLENLISNRRQNTLIKISPELSVKLRQFFNNGTPQHTELNVNHLQILRSRHTGDFTRFRPYVDDDRALDDGDDEVGALVADVGENTSAEGVEHDGTFTTVDVVNAGVDGEGAYGEGAGGRGNAA
mmetsp:Transcript_20392/g.36628  ORF Transcript_20392/g.36628 Transcript_20392/m.36628 type:complete len:300 (+) Transcript_20392:422-1321(+)